MSKEFHYSERFLKCVERVLMHEGGYVDDPADAGGETNYGISKRAFPDVDVKNLTREQAVSIYHLNYWIPIKGDFLLSEALAMQVFDMSVNAGTKTAVKILQRIVGAYLDGVIGPATLAAIGRNPSLEALTERYRFERAAFYASLAIKNSSQLRFLAGWINRI